MTYDAVHAAAEKIGVTKHIVGMLYWDMNTIMPRGSADVRAEQLALLQVSAHEAITSPRLAERIAAAEADESLTPWQRANLRELAHQRLHSVAVPATLLEAMTRQSSKTQMLWRDARPADDYASLLPAFRETLRLVQEVAEAKASALGCSPYDALVDRHDPGSNEAEIRRIFGDLAGFHRQLVDEVIDAQAAARPPVPPTGTVDRSAQRAAFEEVMRALGFNFEQGRLDESLHPFCGGAPGDVRITTRYSDTDFVGALQAVIHETGHALYEQGLPVEWRNQPVGGARGMTLHESQSLLMEMQLSHSREFVTWLAPTLRRAFGTSGDSWSADNLYAWCNRVERGLIRVEADEVTYPAHVLMRFDLERALISGDLDPAELPGAWRELSLKYVGVAADTDRDGCMQDIHWFDGEFGYFPSYTLGAITAAQLFAAARRQLPGMMRFVGEGNFASLVAWVRDNIHAKASSLGQDELMRQATGRSLAVDDFEKHLRARYLGDAG